MKVNYSSFKDIFVEKKDVLASVKSVLDKLDPNQYRNKLLKIAACDIEPKVKEES